jgi:arylformamidase
VTIRDISQPLRSGLPVWPGDTEFAAKRFWTYGLDCPVNVSSVTMSTHGGTHADAPFHYDPQGAPVDKLPLDAYIGPARVVDARICGNLVTAAMLEPHLTGAPPRILLRTYDRFPSDAWDPAFAAIDPAVIELLADIGTVLIGIDAPSIDPEDSQTMDAHLAVHRADMRILEGLVLDGVPAGDYELIALPLSFVGLDASPVRAILRDLA